MQKNDLSDLTIMSPQPESPDLRQSPENVNYMTYAIAGSISGLVMETAVHPIDTIRTRIKANSKEFVTFTTQAKRMFIKEGPFSYWRGISCTFF